MDVGGVVGPGEKLTLGSLKLVPSLVSCQRVGVEFREELRGDDRLNYLSDLISRRPDITEHDRVALGIGTDRLDIKVDVDGASKCVGDNERG